MALLHENCRQHEKMTIGFVIATWKRNDWDVVVKIQEREGQGIARGEKAKRKSQRANG